MKPMEPIFDVRHDHDIKHDATQQDVEPDVVQHIHLLEGSSSANDTNFL